MDPNIKLQVQKLRSSEKSYSEIQAILNQKISKSTLSYWCRHIFLSKTYYKKIKEANELHLAKARILAANVKRQKHKLFIKSLKDQNVQLLKEFRKNKHLRKVALAILHLAEGNKGSRGSLTFGNSDPDIILMFVSLFRECYKTDEQKFRCTVQCRADQNIEHLENFWSKVTKIPLTQFYKARVDKRSVGQVSKKLDYKGVCRIDYFSARIDFELKWLAREILKEFSNGPMV